jgi:hypothetical protein
MYGPTLEASFHLSLSVFEILVELVHIFEYLVTLNTRILEVLFVEDFVQEGAHLEEILKWHLDISICDDSVSKLVYGRHELVF